MSEFNLVTADKAQLKAYAKHELELTLTLTMSEDTMRQKIVAKCEELEIEPPVSEVIDKKRVGGKRHKIIVAKAMGPDGSIPVFVGVQGVGYTIPRGIGVVVPIGVVEVLKNAVQDIVTQDLDTGEILHEDVPTYPFTDLGEVA